MEKWGEGEGEGSDLVTVYTKTFLFASFVTGGGYDVIFECSLG